MVDQVDVHGMVFKQVVNHVEIINRPNLGLIRLTILEHIMSTNHKTSIVRQSEKGSIASNGDGTLRDEGEVSEGDVEIEIIGRLAELFLSNEWLRYPEKISFLGQHLCHLFQEGLRGRLYLKLILDNSSSFIIIITDEVDIIDPRRKF